jgi:hypothetical protein
MVTRGAILASALIALTPSSALAQLPIADLRTSQTIITEVPTFNQFFLVWDPTITPQHPQVVRARIFNNGPAEPNDVSVLLETQGMPEINVEITWSPECDVAQVPASSIRLSWSIGTLRVGASRECDFTFRALPSAPILPPLQIRHPFGFRATTAQTRPPPPSVVYSGPTGIFTVFPTTRVLSDIAVEIEPPTLFLLPGQSRLAQVRLTNRGPDTFEDRLVTVFNLYTHTVTEIPAPEGFRIFPAVAAPEDCIWSRQDLGVNQSGIGRRWIVSARGVPPGQSIECPFIVEALSNAHGSFSLPVTQRTYQPGVVDPALGDNISYVNMVFNDGPLPVTATHRYALMTLAALLAVFGLLAIGRRAMVRRVREG